MPLGAPTEQGYEFMHDRPCIELMSAFIEERPELWYEDIAGGE